MTDHEGDPELQAAFDDLRESVGSEVDVDTGLQDLHRTAGSRSHRGRIGRPAILGIAAAVVAVLAIGAIAVWQNGGDGHVVSADGTDNAPVAPTDPQCEDEVFVYLDPSATAEQVAAVGQVIAGLDGVVDTTYMDSADTYAEFRRLFADSPEFVDSIDPAELPSSYRLTLEPLAEEQVARLGSESGVLRVEWAEEHACRTAAEKVPSEAATTTTVESTTTLVAATTTSPVAVDGAPDIEMGIMTFATAQVPTDCVSASGGRTPEQEAVGCPPPGEQILGTVTVDGTAILVTSATGLFGCGPADGAMVIPFSEVLAVPADFPGRNIVAVWLSDTSADVSLPFVRAQQLSIGSCG